MAEAKAIAKAPVAPDPMEVMVKIKLFKDSKEYKDDLVVGINGKVYQIQRGKEVLVPLAVAEIIRTSQDMDTETANKITEAEMKYARDV